MQNVILKFRLISSFNHKDICDLCILIQQDEDLVHIIWVARTEW